MFAPTFPKPYDQLEQLAMLAFFVGIYPIAAKKWDSVKRLGEWLESRATGKAKRALESIVSLMPDTANKQTISEGGKVEFVEVPAEYIDVGDIVLVKTGDKIPVDGDVIKGESVVDESSLTGESRPVKKKVKSQVFSGTINIGMAPLTVTCTATTENSTVSKLIELVEEAQANRSPTEKLVDEFAKRYTPVVVVTSFLMCTVPFFVAGKEVGMEWLYRGIVLIVIACPCALIISTPVAYVAGLAATAQKGIIIKGGVHLEALSRVKIVASDKTGTLTHGEFAVLHVDMVGKWKKKKEVFRRLAVMERDSSHPMASEHEILKGEGVQGVVGGTRMYVGNARLMERLGLLKGLDVSVLRKTKTWSKDAEPWASWPSRRSESSASSSSPTRSGPRVAASSLSPPPPPPTHKYRTPLTAKITKTLTNVRQTLTYSDAHNVLKTAGQTRPDNSLPTTDTFLQLPEYPPSSTPPLPQTLAPSSLLKSLLLPRLPQLTKSMLLRLLNTAIQILPSLLLRNILSAIETSSVQKGVRYSLFLFLTLTSNLLTTDIPTLESTYTQIHTLWDAPLQCGIYIYLLHRILQNHVRNDLLILLLTVPLSTFFVKRSSSIRRKTLPHKDSRLRHT
ncbi:hypothetical protein TrLO_g10203 [Triparma laevis f. longispina]|uniref:P-type ATPase A domain-containing protein n=1 Tax=Triparma laevis f. longispina TaxID=1714387 RepID=A0A9W7F386_9STRA|nr:hypothetical protein TrLO_g10203 [Triparma laevis f. longispina]